MNREQKSLTNKGFSLVELIIVVAIMAILIGVLAPQYLRYVEKSRHQKDNTSIGEIADIMKMTSADENLISALADGVDLKFDNSTGQFLGCVSVTVIQDELRATLGAFDGTDSKTQIFLTSNAYKNSAPTIHVEVETSTNVVVVTCEGWIDPGATSDSKYDKIF